MREDKFKVYPFFFSPPKKNKLILIYYYYKKIYTIIQSHISIYKTFKVIDNWSKHNQMLV